MICIARLVFAVVEMLFKMNVSQAFAPSLHHLTHKAHSELFRIWNTAVFIQKEKCNFLSNVDISTHVCYNQLPNRVDVFSGNADAML